MKRRTVLLIAMILCLSGCSLQLNNPLEEEESIEEIEGIKKVEEIQQVSYLSGNAAKEDCLLNGTHSMLNDNDLNPIGILNLANGKIYVLQMFEDGDNGKLKDNSGYLNIMSISDDGRSGIISFIGNRGICDLNLSWDEEREITMKKISPLYCSDCMKKIVESDTNQNDEFPDEKRCPFAIFDFVTKKIYSLNGSYKARIIQDYYVYFEYSDRKIKGIIVYTPERFQK